MAEQKKHGTGGLQMSASKFLPCPFCGRKPVDDPERGVSSIEKAEYGFELRHHCFSGMSACAISISTIIFKGCTKEEVVERWNRRTKDV